MGKTVMRKKHALFLLSPMLFLALLCPLPASSADAQEMTEEELKSAVGGDAEVRSLISMASDPVGEEGLWGMEMTMIIDHPADKVYAALADIEKYPDRIKKVKDVKVLERRDNGIVVEHTEGAMGIEMTSTLEYSFDPERRTIISRSIGEDDTVSWSRTEIEEVGHPGYCRFTMTVYADTAWVPMWVMNMATSLAGKETADVMRKLIDAAESDGD